MHNLQLCVCVRSGIPAESEPGAGGHVSAEPPQSVPACSHQHVCCHHQVHTSALMIILPPFYI